MECTLEAETSVSNLTQGKLFIRDDKKNMLFGVTFSFKKKPESHIIDRKPHCKVSRKLKSKFYLFLG